ncbi:MAG: bis-aminopropyl spermidine synthase family protein [Candidatus Eremiobacterota bacterium]
MVNKVKEYIREINNITDDGKGNNKYYEKMNNYNKYMEKIKENYQKQLKFIEKEIPLLKDKYMESLFGRASEGTGYKGERPAEIRKKIEDYQQLLRPECAKVLLGSLEATKEFMKYLFYQEELAFDFTNFEGRPSLKAEWGQAYCNEASCLKRVKLLLRDFTDDSTKVLFLGDDDLTSLVLASLSNFEVHVIDIDEELLKFIKSKNPAIHTRTIDLNKEIPEDMAGYFDAVSLHPYLNLDGIKMFLRGSVDCLKKHKNSRIYMTSWPVALSDDEYATLQRIIIDSQLIFREIITNFDCYDLSDWYSDMDNTLNISAIGEIMGEGLVKKLAHLPAITPAMYILSPALYK